MSYCLIDPLLEDSFLVVSAFLLNLIGGHGGVLAHVDNIFPGEELHAILFVRGTSEMAVCGSGVVFRFSKRQITGQGTRTAIEVDLDHFGNLGGGEAFLLGSVGLDEDGQRLSDTNGVRKLNTSTLGESGLDDGLGNPTARVGGRSIDLGRILSGESTSSVGTPSTVGINDDLTSGKSGISLRSSNDEFTRGVDVEVAGGAVIDGKGAFSALELDRLESGLDDVLVDEFVHFVHGGGNHFIALVLSTVVLSALFFGTLGLEGLGVLRGDNNGVDLDRSDGSIRVLLVFDGDLGLSIGSQPPEASVLSDIRQFLSELCGHHVGQRHELFGFVTGVTKHDTLITGTNIEVGFANVDASGDIGRLLVDSDQNLASVTRQTLGVDGTQIVFKRVESDFTNLRANDSFVIDLSSGGDFTENHDHVVLGGGFASDLGERIGLQAGVEDGIGNLIGELVGVTLVNGFRGEEEVALFGGNLDSLGGFFAHFGN
mmetsp:Transcript_26376/g.57789  ORF Transcript_26376/g.57789 Transcript_26376/m.57789 type:complete len:485 (+) Transcript_26376:43-1497(+)